MKSKNFSENSWYDKNATKAERSKLSKFGE